MPNFENNFASSLVANQGAGVTAIVLNDNPTSDPPYYLALDATDLNSHYEVILVTADDGAGTLTHAATTYAHTTAEEVRMVCPAVHLNTMQNMPDGTMINGKITPTDAAGLTLTLQTASGANPSVTNPVYVKIGGTIRSITAALSVAKADGTNWFNSGSAELATKEVDYFAYLGYNATDGVVLGFSRIPYATLYSDFSATTTNEKYCAISTITNAAAGDNYVNIGRFAATLSAGAGYTWTVPTYTTTNLIQRPIYETRWLDWVPTAAGFNGAVTYGSCRYLIRNQLVNYKCSITGTSNATTFTFQLPMSHSASNLIYDLSALVKDNNSYQAAPGLLEYQASTTVNVYKNSAFTAFTNSNAKEIRANGFYEI
jgi:hypothetical protein